jgi:hypothetical protein
MRTLVMSAALVAALAACSPPAQQETEAEAPPAVIACSALTPDAARQVRVEEEVAAASAASDLRGGRITPGVYDLVSAHRIGAATGWQGTRAVALGVAENAAGGVTFNWAGAAPGGEVDRWTASFTDTPQVRLAYTCGRIGEVDADFAAEANTLQLRLPDGANGALLLLFQRRP